MVEAFNEIQRMLGKQYYKHNEDESVDLLRVIAIKGKESVKVLNSVGETESMNPKDILEDYTELTPDGLVTITTVDMGKDSNGYNLEDVIVALYRESDTNLGNYEPFAVCRQNITDFFANYLDQTGNGTNLVGVSVSKNTCPENIDYRVMVACNDVKSDKVAISIYVEDTVDSILAMAKPKRFDRVLESLQQQHIKWKHGMDMGQLSDDGYCRTLKQLLDENNFQFDFDSAFNILKIDDVIEPNLIEVDDEVFGKYMSLPNYITNELSNIFKMNIQDTIVIPFNHDISLDDLAQSKYLILRDNDNLLYIVNYTTVGEFRETDLEVIAAKEAMEKHTIFDFNKSKYKNILK